MNDNKEITALTNQENEEFRGYTMEELRYQRALIALRKEFSKTKMQKTWNNFRTGGRDESRQASALNIAGGIAAKILSGMNVVDYALMGVSLFGTGKKIYKKIASLRRKK